jgi:hypothetical protein
MARSFLFVALVAAVVDPSEAQTRSTENVVLVTADGLRPQELFGGADVAILDDGEASGIEDVASIRERFWRTSARERREVLLPFFWKTLVPRGVLFGDRSAGSAASVTNPHRNSYPGYSEILTGRVDPRVTGNIALQNPSETFLESARRELGLTREEVAVFTSWNHFPYIVASRRDAIFVNAGYMNVPGQLADDAMRQWGTLQFRALSPWDSVRHNLFTAELGLAYLKRHRPRVLFLAFDETDEWAHSRRYDRTLESIRLFDDVLRDLVALLESLPDYRGRTTLVVTTDHGRGRTPEDWTSHGSDVPGSEETWIFVLGPDTPAAGVATAPAEVTQSQIAATILEVLGIGAQALSHDAAPPIARALAAARP